MYFWLNIVDVSLTNYCDRFSLTLLFIMERLFDTIIWPSRWLIIFRHSNRWTKISVSLLYFFITKIYRCDWLKRIKGLNTTFKLEIFNFVQKYTHIEGLKKLSMQGILVLIINAISVHCMKYRQQKTHGHIAHLRNQLKSINIFAQSYD